jgi:hypothetical protein
MRGFSYALINHEPPNAQHHAEGLLSTAKFLFEASYTVGGLKGLQGQGASSAAGSAAVRTVVLLTPEDVDAAITRSVDYQPPTEPRHF